MQWPWQHAPLPPPSPRASHSAYHARPSSYPNSGQRRVQPSGAFFACGIARRNDWLR
jgi:hypothetical protein